MTLSNFDWTDKDSVRWFILLPTGHEGPYSHAQLTHLYDRKKISHDTQVWAEGLMGPVTYKELTDRSVVSYREVQTEEIPPSLLVLPEDEIPPIPEGIEEPRCVMQETIPPKAQVKKKIAWPLTGLVAGVLFLVIIFGAREVLEESSKVEIRRMPKMSPELHERILRENSFLSWDKKIFFREYVSDDHGQIWLVNSGFQDCEVEASFKSVEGKLLSMEDEEVHFMSRGSLVDHIVNFSDFDFLQGTKIIPGLYELNVKAVKCNWGSFLAKVMNGLESPEREYLGRMKVILFSRGAQEFNAVLKRILRRKEEILLKEKNKDLIFWQDLEQKFATLEAITLQVEQLVLDFLQKNPKDFHKNLNPMISQYTRQYGSFLNAFVTENESYFKSLRELQGASQKRNYELLIRQTTTRIGLESMKFIEEFQSWKKTPKKEDLKGFEARVRSIYKRIKNDISQKRLQVSLDQSKL